MGVPVRATPIVLRRTGEPVIGSYSRHKIQILINYKCDPPGSNNSTPFCGSRCWVSQEEQVEGKHERCTCIMDCSV